MAYAPQNPERRSVLGAPIELVWVIGSALALLAVVACGSALVELAQLTSPWLFMAAYAIPGAIAWGIFWLICRRIDPDLRGR